ncbi:MAG: EAL domain-containing protein [Synechococcaceae cyanobacterium SM1_2_3]|nr:EAL domain-containing protein [Synechococcaceae cyanobacterium SM1_2_3]
MIIAVNTLSRRFIQLGKGLDMEIITEGIETEEQFTRLAQMGCDYAQGYLIARPAPVDSFFEPN